ncbi:MAG: DNA (cytosine-5-)-methyltransferase, partial [Oscillospiraceae bacterium]
MIKLATVFSGIGAIEHALYRMGIEHKIIFACDSGDVDILNKEIGLNIDEIQEEIIELNSVIIQMQDIETIEDLYKKQLFGMFTEMSIEYNNIMKALKSINEPLSDISDVLFKVLSMKSLKKARLKEYSKFLEELKLGTEPQKRLKDFQV